MAYDFGFKPMSQAPKLEYGKVADFLEDQAKRAEQITPGRTAAQGFFRSQAEGRPDVGTQAIIDANREAMSRQAQNVRAGAAQFAAQNLGQGDAVKARQQAELGILSSLGDSRNKELQTLSASRTAANEKILDEDRSSRQNLLQGIQAAMQYGSPAAKKAGSTGLMGFLESQGVQTPTAESAEKYNAFVLQQAENDPKALIERVKAEDEASKLLVDRLKRSGSSKAIIDAYQFDEKEATRMALGKIAAYNTNFSTKSQYKADLYENDTRAAMQAISNALKSGDPAELDRVIAEQNLHFKKVWGIG